jgi:hypothetical protein
MAGCFGLTVAVTVVERCRTRLRLRKSSVIYNTTSKQTARGPVYSTILISTRLLLKNNWIHYTHQLDGPFEVEE